MSQVTPLEASAAPSLTTSKFQTTCSKFDPNSVAGDCNNAVFALTVICKGFDGPADAADQATASALVGICIETMTKAKDIANADTDLATAVANGDTVGALEDVCNSMQEFIDQNCDDGDTVGICLMLGSTVNDACIDVIGTNAS